MARRTARARGSTSRCAPCPRASRADEPSPTAITVLRIASSRCSAGCGGAGTWSARSIVFACARASPTARRLARARCSIRSTRLGQFLDPAADKLMVLVCFLVAAARGAVPVWLAVLVIGRDVVLASAARCSPSSCAALRPRRAGSPRASASTPPSRRSCTIGAGAHCIDAAASRPLAPVRGRARASSAAVLHHHRRHPIRGRPASSALRGATARAWRNHAMRHRERSCMSPTKRGVRWIALDRPESKNGLTDEVNGRIIEALDGAAADHAHPLRGAHRQGRQLLLRPRPEGGGRAASGGFDNAEEHMRKYFHGLIRAVRRVREAGGGAGRRRGGRLRLRPGAGLRPAHRHRAHALRRGVRQARPHARRRRHLDAAAPGGRGQGARAHVHRRHRSTPTRRCASACSTASSRRRRPRRQTWAFAERLAAGPPLVHALRSSARSTPRSPAPRRRARDRARRARCSCSARKDFFEGMRRLLPEARPRSSRASSRRARSYEQARREVVGKIEPAAHRPRAPMSRRASTTARSTMLSWCPPPGPSSIIAFRHALSMARVFGVGATAPAGRLVLARRRRRSRCCPSAPSWPASMK